MVNIAGFDIQLALQQVQNLLVDVLGYLKADRWPKAATKQFFFQLNKEVFTLVLINLKIFISGDAEGVVLQYLHTREEL